MFTDQIYYVIIKFTINPYIPSSVFHICLLSAHSHSLLARNYIISLPGNPSPFQSQPNSSIHFFFFFHFCQHCHSVIVIFISFISCIFFFFVFRCALVHHQIPSSHPFSLSSLSRFIWSSSLFFIFKDPFPLPDFIHNYILASFWNVLAKLWSEIAV